ncbi:bacillithiol biosynthesis deacetylase BshB1 [Bacillus sp. AGMB 02131]|uniref:Bacillithiol biosynthesis deacetylase BshB1 n=1 Tax=Peribacillus faecalis TaxID=2772559 RepID=A0A927D2L1_9BACI|nr:bacillithiol biosynthesis deacetylase BshB1 [Peribacillus faecalis]MBD3110415.1 bacillithiol biosynthesis deacetylase BshB1 [Peribacillus faecalis]
MQREIDILAIGAHADDVEIGMGGTIAKFASAGKRIVICDLTQAEMSSNGTIHTRMDEAKNAGEVLGILHRINAYLPDRGLFLKEEYISRVASIIRLYRPKLVFVPYEIDRHPDHGNCAKLVEEACFSAGVRKYVDEQDQPPHRVENMYYYMINGFHKPDFAVDVTEFIEAKTDGLKAYKSQFEKTESSFQTPLVDDYIESIISRDKMIGKEVGVRYAEGFFSKKPLLLSQDLLGGKA